MKRSKLTYTVQRPQPGTLAAFSEAIERLATGRQSVAEWRRRCEASLRASRRRRGLRP